jgi:hypothetical protein
LDNSENKDIAYKNFREWKKDKISNKYLRPTDWVIYFGDNHFLSANSSRVNLLNNNLYNELKNNPTIEIE